MGSSATVADLAAAGQRVADVLSHEEYARMQKEAEDTMQFLALKKQQAEYERKPQMKGHNKREAALAAMDRGLKQGKQSKKSLEGSHPYKKTGWQ